MKRLLYPLTYGGLSKATHRCITRDFSRPGADWGLGEAPEDGAADRVRNKIATRFLNIVGANPECLVMVDHDISWAPGDLEYIADVAVSRRGVASALVSCRSLGSGWGSKLDKDQRAEIGTDQVLEIKQGYLGGAMIAIERSVIERLAEQLPLCVQGFYPMFVPQFIERDGLWYYLSEDWSFSHWCRLLSIPLLLCMRPVAGHHGQAVFGPLEGVG